MDTKKIFLLFVMGIFLISMVSATLKSYDEETKTVRLSSNFLFINTGDIATVTLTTPLNNRVGLGYQKVAEMEIKGFKDYQDFISDLEFYDARRGLAKINRNFDLKKKGQDQILIPDYSNVEIGTYQNGTKIYERQQTGSHYETIETWQKLTPADLKKNDNLTVGIFTEVQAGDKVEWIPTIANLKIEEWAVWTADLNVGLVSYYKFDEGSGAVIDSINFMNLTNSGATNTTGIIKSGYDFEASESDYMTNSSNYGISGTQARTINVWVNLETNVTQEFVSTGTISSGKYWALRYSPPSLSIDYEGSNTVSNTTIPSLGNWIMITGSYDGTKGKIFVNGQLTADETDTISTTLTLFNVGKRGNNANYVDGKMDEIGVWNRSLSQAEVTQLYNGGDGISYTNVFGSGLTITLNSPENYYNQSTSDPINFNVTVTDDFGVASVNLSIDGVLNETNTSTFNGTYIFSKIIAEGSHNWTIDAYDSEGNHETSSTRFFDVDYNNPVLTSASNLTNLTTFILPTNSTWSFSASDPHLDQCYYNSTDHAQTIITCNSTIQTEWATQGEKEITYCANDTFGFETCNTDTINIFLISYDQTDTPDPVAEGFNAVFNLTVNMTSIPSTTATLILNNTVYTATSTASTNSYFFTRTVTIPDTWGNATGILQDWYWNYTITGVTSQNTSTSNITVYELAIDDCSSYGEVILDMSLLDEETKSAVNESAGANVEIDLQLTSKDDASVYLQYNNTWTDENNPKVCIPLNVLNNSEYWMDFTVGFQATDHVWEFYYLDDGTLNSTKIFDVQTSTPLYFYDLLTADSTSFLFNYFDQDGLAVEDAIVHVYRKYIGDGTFKEVERAKADLNGDTIVHLVEEDVIYYFVISQYGDILFTSSQYTALCQATPCTIQIEASGEGADFSTDWDLIDGGAYTITSLASSRTVNLTYSLNDTSTMNLTVYKYNNDGSYEAIETGSDTGSSGSIVLTVPQSAGNVSFFATVYQDDVFKNSEWVDFEGDAQDKFGVTLSLFIGALIILTLGLMAVTEGVGTLVFVILGVALAGFLGLITTELSTGVNIVVYLVVAGGILLWKLTGGRR